MRFGRSLDRAINPRWREAYIDYLELKKLLREPPSPASSPVRGDSSNNTSKPNSINEAAGDDKWTEADEKKFVNEILNNQLEKVSAFQKKIVDELRDEMVKCEIRLKPLEPAVASLTAANDQVADVGSAPISPHTPTRGAHRDKGKEIKTAAEYDNAATVRDLLSTQRMLDGITDKLTELEKYSRINYTGFLKAAKKHDRKRGHLYKIKPLLQVKLTELLKLRNDHSSLLYRLSVMYTFIRQGLAAAGHESTPTENAAIDTDIVDPDGFASFKFWVHPDNVLEVKTIILRELPVLVYNPQPSKLSDTYSETHQDPSLTSIYFDNSAFELYGSKVTRDESASSVRLRWYGHLEKTSDVALEKKTHGKVDARVQIKEKNVQGFIAGEYGFEKEVRKLRDRTVGTTGAAALESPGLSATTAGSSAVAAANKAPGSTASSAQTPAENLRQKADLLQQFIMERNLRPVVRATYSRTAYEIPRDDRVRISLDTDVAFIREGGRHPDGSWLRSDIDGQQMEYPFDQIRKDDISRFPYALLDIRVQNKFRHSGAGRWVDELMSSHLITAAPGFSKFVHGIAVLNEDDVDSLPFWLNQLDTDIRRDPVVVFEEQKARQEQDAADQLAVGVLHNAAIQSVGSVSSRPLDDIRAGILSPAGASLSQSASKGGPSFGQLGQAREKLGIDEGDDEDDEDASLSSGSRASRPTMARGLSRLITPFLSSGRPHVSDGSDVPNARLPSGLSAPTTWLKDRGPVQVEGKVWLANQRTFIKWMHIAVLLSSLSLALYNAAMTEKPKGGKKGGMLADPYAAGIAIVYLSIAVFSGLWGWWTYLHRADLIRRRSGKDLSAPLGPTIVAIALAGALVLNYWMKLKVMFPA